jgi:hypothetical protein
MRMTSRRRLPFLFGLVFVVIGALFWVTAPMLGYRIEPAGVVLLLALGVAMALMTYVLSSGLDD